MTVNIIIALIGLIGIALGTLLSGIGYYLKTKSERLKTKKSVLFHLLEIRQLIKSEYVNPTEVSNEYLKYCSDYLSRKGIAEEDNSINEMKPYIESHFKSIIEASKPSLDLEFVKSFENSICALSFDHPVLAFQLRGRDKVSQILEAQRKYIDNYSVFFDIHTPKYIQDASTKQINNMNYRVIEDLINDIDSDIKLVSSKSGILTQLLVRKILKKNIKKTATFNWEQLDPIFDEFIDALTEAVNKSNKLIS